VAAVDEAARRRLVEEHLPLVRAIAVQVKKQLSERLEVDELVGYGSEGLLEAAGRFDPAHGVKFSTFAWHRIRGAIYDGLREMGHLKRADYARLQLATRAGEVLENLAERERGAAEAQGGVAPAPSAEDDLRSLHAALSAVTATFVASLEAMTEQGVEFAADEPPLDEALDARDAVPRVRAVLGQLPEKERHFIVKHYFEGKTLLEAGAELGLSKSWASRLHARAVEMLRDKLRDAA
jgi:RNA polymerase sigma factor for flagellar operon FliA